MLSQFIVSHFIKNNGDSNSRKTFGYIGGIIGIILNISLFLIKLTAGFVSHSIAITVDAFNNLTDAASSIITILGFKMADKPADKKHPFGHGRFEYLSGLIVSFMIMIVGFEFVKASYEKIVHPTKVNFEIIPFLLILVSITIKIWLAKFNRYIGKMINSTALKASSLDAAGDVIISSCTAFSLLMSKFTSLPIDGYLGILVALFLMYSGYSLVGETLNPLIGEPPDPELVQKIAEGVTSYPYISGTHDLIIHNYGPGKFMATIHAEVPCDISIVKIHEIIDKAEKELSAKLNICLVIHMDPINTDDKTINDAREEVLNLLKDFPQITSMHDFRVVGTGEYKNLVFDIVIDSNQKLTPKIERELKKNINSKIQLIHPHYNAVITIDRDYTQ